MQINIRKTYSAGLLSLAQKIKVREKTFEAFDKSEREPYFWVTLIPYIPELAAFLECGVTNIC